MQTSGEMIRYARKAKRMTLDQLAIRARLTKGFLSLVENGKSSLGVASSIRISEALDIPPREIIEAVNNEQAKKTTNINGVLKELVLGIERWANECDGVPEWLLQTYLTAKEMLGEVKNEHRTPGAARNEGGNAPGVAYSH